MPALKHICKQNVHELSQLHFLPIFRIVEVRYLASRRCWTPQNIYYSLVLQILEISHQIRKFLNCTTSKPQKERKQTYKRKYCQALHKLSILIPLTAKDELSRPGNLTFLQSWTPRRIPRRIATHAPLYNTLPSNNQNQSNYWHLRG